MCLRLAIAYMSGYESYPLIFMWSEEVTMGLLELFLLAIGLSMDAFAVSVCKGLAMQKVNFRSAAICGVWFGGFQALMPFIGYLLGAGFEKYINAVASWIAFVLLALIFSSLFSWTPGLKTVSPGLSIVICTVAAAAICAALFPVKEEREAA